MTAPLPAPVDVVGLLAALRDVVGARSTSQVESAALSAARSLLDADAGFWLDQDATGDLHMRSIAGFVQPEAHVFSAVPAGAGVTAEILARDAPVAVTDYARDPRAVPSLAALFRSEGIVSVAGAPLRTPRGPAGALYVLSRRRRSFTEEELQLLVSVAGVAKELRTRLEERDAAVTDAGDQRRRADEGVRLHRAAERLAAALVRGHPLESGLAAASDALGVRLHVEGLPRGALPPVAAADAGSLTGSLIGSLTGPDAGPYDGPDDGPDDGPEGAGGEPPSRRTRVGIPGADLAVLVVEAPLPARDLELLARIIGLDFHRQRAQVETEIRLTDQFVHSLLSGEKEELDRLWRCASLLGMNLAVPRAVVSVGQEGAVDRLLLDRVCREMRARTSGGQATIYRGDIVLIWPVPQPADEQRLREHLLGLVLACRPQKLTVGIGPICRRAEDYPGAVREAVFARQVARHSTTDKRVVAAEELGMYRLFAHVGGMQALRDAVLGTLGPLLEADARDGSDLADTLRAFLERDRRTAETARALHVHVNTLRYRIERISRLLAVDLDDPDVRFFVLLALRLATVVGGGNLLDADDPA